MKRFRDRGYIVFLKEDSRIQRVENYVRNQNKAFIAYPEFGYPVLVILDDYKGNWNKLISLAKN